MSIVNVGDAKTQLSRLIEAALAGEDVVIARAGKPAVRLVPVHEGPRRPGAYAGKVTVDAAFFEPLPDEELDAWER